MKLDELTIENLGVVSHVQASFGDGLIAITGETGAGKTLLVTALSLLSGTRATAEALREGTDEARIAARFVDDDQEVILRRVIGANGRSKAYVNDEPVTLGELQRQAAQLFEIHGQHSQQGLFVAGAQRDALDAFGNVDTTQLHTLRSELKDVQASLTSLLGDPRERERELDLLRFQCNEIREAAIEDVNEEQKLEEQINLLGNAVALRESTARIHSLLQGEGGAYDQLSEAAASIRDVSSLTKLQSRLMEAREDVEDIGREVSALEEQISDDPAMLESLHQRAALLGALRRKYGESLNDVKQYFLKTQARVDELSSAEERAEGLRSREDALTIAIAQESAQVRAAREVVAGKFAQQVTTTAQTLALPHANVSVALDDSPAADGVTLLFSANPGMRPAALSKIASGGELSRVMLAIRLASHGDVATVVFDEVDAGVGGEAARAIGQALAQLGARCQVILVTHLPQIAAFADQHFNVAKSQSVSDTSTAVVEVRDDARIIEISRMLSGQPGSETAQGHAEELIDLAAVERESIRGSA